MSTASEYRIVVRGRVGPRFTDVFDSMRHEPAPGGQALVGAVRDQAELKGMLDLLCCLGVEIVSFAQTGALSPA